jgi:hypothetical protein
LLGDSLGPLIVFGGGGFLLDYGFVHEATYQASTRSGQFGWDGASDYGFAWLRVNGNGLLRQTVEEFSSIGGPAAVEAESEFVKVVAEAFLSHRLR